MAPAIGAKWNELTAGSGGKGRKGSWCRCCFSWVLNSPQALVSPEGKPKGDVYVLFLFQDLPMILDSLPALDFANAEVTGLPSQRAAAWPICWECLAVRLMDP